MNNQKINLFNDYSVAQVGDDAFYAFFHENRSKIFTRDLDFRVREVFSEDEHVRYRTLRERLGDPFKLNFWIYHRDSVVGWSFGTQLDPERFYMVNTALFPEHQNKGVYSRFLSFLLAVLREEGFQVVTSKHKANNNQALVPKLKAGFVISGFQISDVFGLLVELSYYFNPLRRKAHDFRVGQMLDSELQEYFAPL